MSQSTSEAEKFHILVVDDETDLRESLALLVTRLGFLPLSAGDGEAALALVAAHGPTLALILSDFKMPKMNGFEFRAKVLEILPAVPFVISSAYVSREEALKEVNLKVSAFLDKPVGEKEIAECIARESKERIKSLREEREFLKGFLEEATANLEQVEPLIFELESHPQDAELINRIFGLVHTLKGASGFFQPLTLHHFVHKFEDLLTQIKNGKRLVDPDSISLILKSTQIVSDLINEFKADKHTLKFETLVTLFTESSRAASQVAGEPAAKALAPGGAVSSATEAKKDLKVSVELLDEFMQLSGNMTVVRNMIDRTVRALERAYPFDKNISALSELVDETHKINSYTQAKIVELRKIPVRNLLKTFPRLVRDLAVKLDKEVDFVSRGDDLTIDTAVADVLSKSLIHMIRNSLDHGLENPDIREQLEKPRKGTITIASRMQGDDIIIEVSDDGAGINPTRIKDKLLSQGMPKADIEAMNENQVLMQLFAPGFSTAAQITDVSGRGIGMDMVKKSVESLKGEVSIKTKLGEGSLFTLKIPAPRSVHIVNSLIVGLGSQRFCIPQNDILRVMEFRRDDVEVSIVRELQGGRALNYEGKLIPIVCLDEVIQISRNAVREYYRIIILRSSDGKVLALDVDEVWDTEDTVVKALAPFFRNIKVFSGASFMDDGTVGLILSTEGLAEIASSTHVEAKAQLAEKIEHPEVNNVVLFRLHSGKGVFALRQSEVSRFERWEAKRIQKVLSGEVISYRNKIIQLVDLAKLLEVKAEVAQVETDHILCLIVEVGEKQIGLVVSDILDIRPIDVGIDTNVVQPKGYEGVLIYPDYTTTLLNINELLSVASA